MTYAQEVAESPEYKAQVTHQQQVTAHAKVLADEMAVTSFATQDDIDHKLIGKSAAEIAELRSQYDAKNGPGAWAARFGVTDDRRWERMVTVDQTEAKGAASAIFDAMDGMGTNEDGVISALRGKSPDEIAEIKRLYAEMYPGRSMDEDIASEMGGDTGLEAQAILGGDVVAAAVQGLENAAWGIGTDEAKIEEILRGIPADKRGEVAAKYKAKFGVDLATMLDGEFDFSEGDAMLALADGDVNKADAIRLDSAMNGGFLGLGTDKAKVDEILAGSRDPDGLATAYKGVQDEKWLGGDASLAAGLTDELSGADLEVAQLTLLAKSKDKAVAAQAKIDLAAASIQAATDGAGTDEDAVWKQLAGKKPEEQRAIIAAWNEKYGSEDAGFFDMLGGELGAVDPALAAQVKAGKLDPVLALRAASLQAAIGGAGTDEQLIKDTLKGLSRDDIEALRTTFAAAGRDLDKELLGDKTSQVPEEQEGELSGRDAFDVGQMLKGEPRTMEEKLARMQERYQWEREGGNDFVDVFSDSGEALDAKYAQVQALQARAMADGTLDDAERFALERQLDYIDGTQGSYAAAKDRIADTAANVATGVGGLALTLATGGLGSMAAALIGAAGGGASGMLTKYAIKGNAYGDEEMGIDVARTLVSMATAGLGQASSVGGFAADQAASAGLGAVGTKLLEEGIKGGVTGFAGGSLNGLLNEQLWEEGDLGGYLQGIASGTVGGAVQNVASAGFGMASHGKLDSLGPVASKTILGGAGGAVGGAAQTLVDPAAYQGGLDGFLGAAAMSSGMGAFTGAAHGAADGYKDLHAAAAPQTVKTVAPAEAPVAVMAPEPELEPMTGPSTLVDMPAVQPLSATGPTTLVDLPAVSAPDLESGPPTLQDLPAITAPTMESGPPTLQDLPAITVAGAAPAEELPMALRPNDRAPHADYTHEQLAALVPTLPGGSGLEVVPDDHIAPLKPNQIHASTAQKFVHMQDTLMATTAGQKALLVLESLGVPVSMLPGSSYYSPGDGSINIDPTHHEEMAGSMTHEAHHADTDVKMAGKSRDEYVAAMLRDEAEAQSAMFEHYRERGPDAGTSEFGFDAYHGAYNTASAEYQAAHPEATPADVHAHAVEQAKQALQAVFGNATPSTSMMLDPVSGLPVLDPSKPRNYDEHYGQGYDDCNPATPAALPFGGAPPEAGDVAAALAGASRPEDVMAALAGISDLEQRRAVAEEVAAATGKSLDELLDDKLPAEQREQADAILAGKRAAGDDVSELQKLVDLATQVDPFSADAMDIMSWAIALCARTYDIDTSMTEGGLHYDPYLDRSKIAGKATKSDMRALFGNLSYQLGEQPTASSLGSTMGHEVEMHLNGQAAQGTWNSSAEGTAVMEVQAYTYMLENADRFGSTPDELATIAASLQREMKKLTPEVQARVMKGDYSYTEEPAAPQGGGIDDIFAGMDF